MCPFSDFTINNLKGKLINKVKATKIIYIEENEIIKCLKPRRSSKRHISKMKLILYKDINNFLKLENMSSSEKQINRFYCEIKHGN